ncbi:MAG: efflux RND transporter periplasmic adaptor subunit [Pseudomonadota bacterium]
MKKRLRIAIPLVLILAGGVIGFVFTGKQNHSTSLMVSGNIEVTEAQMSFRIPGRLENRLVDEGDNVTKGQLLATLDKTDQQIAVAAAEAGLAHARAVLSELEAGSRPEEIDRSRARVLQAKSSLAELTNGSRVQEIEGAKAELDRIRASAKTAEVQLQQAKADVERFEALFKEGGISQREYELYRTRFESAENARMGALSGLKNARESLSLRVEGPRVEKIENARAALKQAEAEYALVKTGPRKESIEQAAARVRSAEETLNQARRQIFHTELFSPMAGVVLSKSAEAGEYLNPASPVVTIGDIRHPWLRAYINEKDIGRMKLKDMATVTTDAFPKKNYRGNIRFISSQAEFTPKSVQTFEERVKLMFRVKIEVENPDGELKPGMPADAVISISSASTGN